MECPCWSKKPYQECCKRYHDGALPENALLLMRSRYAAYAMHLADYIIQSTHPSNPGYSPDFVRWRQDILHFCQSTHFEGLQILEFVDGEENATVTFRAILKRENKDVSFTEKSHFINVNGKWFYIDGVIKQ